RTTPDAAQRMAADASGGNCFGFLVLVTQSVQAEAAGARKDQVEEYKAEQDGGFTAVKHGQEEAAFGSVADKVGRGAKTRPYEGRAAGKQPHDKQRAYDQLDNSGQAIH